MPTPYAWPVTIGPVCLGKLSQDPMRPQVNFDFINVDMTPELLTFPTYEEWVRWMEGNIVPSGYWEEDNPVTAPAKLFKG